MDSHESDENDIEIDIEEAKPVRSSTILKIVLGHMQMMAICASVDVQWPNVLEPLLVTAQTTASLGARSLSPMCLLPESAQAEAPEDLSAGVSFARTTLYYDTAVVYAVPCILFLVVACCHAVLEIQKRGGCDWI